jgi:threonine dehydratase
MIAQEDIRSAAQRIAPYVRRTPVIELERNAFGSSAHLTLKLESLQHTGSFKPRGAFNRVLSHGISSGTLVAASGGNHGVAVAYVARALGLHAEIFVPTVSSPVKVQRLRDYGATVRIVGDVYADSLEASKERAAQADAFEVHAYDQPEVVAGAGTLGFELSQQAPDLDTVLVACGGGGLIAGVASWYAGKARVVAVEPRACPTLYAAREAGTPVDVQTGGVAGDSLAARRIGAIAFEVTNAHVDRAVLVEEDAISQAQRRLWEDLRVVAEPGGATALAAVLGGAYRPEPGERVGVVVCGGNANLTALQK